MEALFLRVAILSLTCSAVLLPLLLLSPRLRSRYAARTIPQMLCKIACKAAFSKNT